MLRSLSSFPIPHISHHSFLSSFRISKITPHQRSLSQKLAKVRIKSRSKLTASGMSQYELLCKWMKSPIKRYVKGLVFRSSWKGQQQTEARGWGSMNGKLRVSPSSSRRSGLGLTEEGGGNGEKELVLRSGKRGREGEANVGGVPSKGWWSAGKRWVQLGRRRRRSGGRPVCGGGGDRRPNIIVLPSLNYRLGSWSVSSVSRRRFGQESK